MSGPRLPEGGSLIDRTRPISFTFDGTEYEGFEGDTLASALLASGVVGGFRSPILGRPRGIFTAGPEEPTAFVQVTEPWFEAITAATMVDVADGLVAGGKAGVGALTREPRPTKPAVHRSRHADSVVIWSAPRSLHPVTYTDAQSQKDPEPNGERPLILLDGPTPTASSFYDPYDVMPHTTTLGLYDDGYIVALQREAGLDTLWHIRAGRVTLSTGAIERPIPFAGCDLPGVMLAGAVRDYLDRFGVVVGTRVAVFTTNDSVSGLAERLAAQGAEIVATADVRDGWSVAAAEGDDAVQVVRLIGPGGERRAVDADVIAVSGGWNPNLGLYRAIGGGLRYDDSIAAWVPDGTGPGWLTVVGAAAGEAIPPSAPFWYVPADDYSTHFVDLQRDQTVQDVLDAVGGGLRSVEHVKRATYIGTAIDQGRTSGVLTAEIVNDALGWELGAQGPTNARPPSVPVSFAVLAGLDRGPTLLDPVRTTPIHEAHVDRGAVFENVGQWKRPHYFPRAGEEMARAVARECLAVRNAAGALDATTLGKIEVVGPDAPTFLDRMYTNRMSNLAIGSIRYGFMLGVDGMVFDDGVAMRLAEDRYLVTTTTGGAAAVLDRFEEWLQTEWPDLRVYCTSVTEQWSVVAVGGPHARAVVAGIGTDVDLSAEAFPWMTWRDGSVAGVPCRVCRVSFHGELSYELHVSSWHGRHVWDAVMAAGAVPYGTEAMHVLRAEKGYVIVGQDTDGTVTPDDLGMGWIVNPSKGDFIGKRSLVRPDTTRPDRKQLVGLLPDDGTTVLPEGTQIVSTSEPIAPPMPMLGHVTSSYRSAALERAFALAMVRSGRSAIGRMLVAATRSGPVPVSVVEPVFYDPKDERRDG
jgi:sarcosine oxidase, subunit alpha